MEWDKKSVGLLSAAIRDAYNSRKMQARTDRMNFSAIWNKKLSEIGVTVLRAANPVTPRAGLVAPMFQELVETVNYRNALVCDALMVPNPDRAHQFLLVPREVASKILVLGLP